MPDDESLCQSSLWMISGQFVAMAGQAVYFIFIGRALGSREYGAFVGVAALVSALSQFSSLGMEMILVRNISRDRASFAQTWGQALALSTAGFVLLLGAAMLFGRLALRPDLRALVPWIAFADGLLGRFIQLGARAFQGAGCLAWTARLTALTMIARASAAAFVWNYARLHAFHPGALFWAKTYWMATLLVAIVALAAVTIHLGRPRFAPIKRRDLSEGLSFAVSSSSIATYNDIDKTVMVSLGQVRSAGVYSAAYRIVDAASAPIYAVHAAASARFFREGQRGVRSARAFARIPLRRTLPYALAVSALVALGSPLVPKVLGPSFQESVAALRWLCLLPVLRALHYAWGSAITASASQWNRTGTQVGAAVFDLILICLLIPRWSWRGAALASLLSDGLLAAASLFVLTRLARRETSAVPERRPPAESTPSCCQD